MAAPFDLDRRLTEVTPPRFRAGGVEYVGRLASWEQITRWAAAAQALGGTMQADAAGAGAIEPALAALLDEMTRALFPAPPAPPWWRRWTRVPPAWEVVAGLPPAVQYELLVSFCAALATMMPGTAAPTETTPTKSPRSPRSGPPRTSADGFPTSS